MEGFRRRLPPLTSLVVFEAAARRLSFTRAAAELSVTQAAVSRQIHGLEQELGFALFRRLHRRIELTERGQVLADVLSQSLNLIDHTVAKVRAQSEEDELVIGASIAFTQLWLLPRISDFRRLHPETKIRLLSQDTQVDLAGGTVDLAIRYGDGAWADGRSVLLCDDDVFPVCSPAYAAGCRLPETAGEFLEHTLLDYDSSNPGWIGWKEWLSAFAVTPTGRPMLRLSYYTDVIHAALAGHGIALGWRCLMEDLLQQNRLCRVLPFHMRTRSAYFVVVPNQEKVKANTQAFVGWLGSHLKSSEADAGT
ncbi:MAG: LysR substrate-binding domain-containing protein [Geminicoccaceae bacterium]